LQAALREEAIEQNRLDFGTRQLRGLRPCDQVGPATRQRDRKGGSARLRRRCRRGLGSIDAPPRVAVAGSHVSGSCGLLGEIRSSRRILPWRTAVSLAAMTPRCLSDLRGLGIIRGPASGCPASNPSGKVPDTHSVGSICDHDFGVFTVTNIATENTGAVPPAHPVPRMPKAANHGLRRCRGPRVPLTCLAPLAAWQSLCTGHVDASLGKFCRTGFNRRGPPERR